MRLGLWITKGILKPSSYGTLPCVTTVLVEALAVVTENYEDRVFVQPQLLVLIDEAFEEVVLIAEGVEVAV